MSQRCLRGASYRVQTSPKKRLPDPGRRVWRSRQPLDTAFGYRAIRHRLLLATRARHYPARHCPDPALPCASLPGPGLPCPDWSACSWKRPGDHPFHCWTSLLGVKDSSGACRSIRVLRMVAHKRDWWDRVVVGSRAAYGTPVPGGCTHGSREACSASWVHHGRPRSSG